jgi:hypothetical protein
MKRESAKADDPVLSMLGIGAELWQTEPGDVFVERLRSEDSAPDPPLGLVSTANLPEVVWNRIEAHQGDWFHTATGKPFTFEVEGTGVWFFREGNRVNRKLTRKQVNIAISRCPLQSTTEIKDLMDYPYLYSLLMDLRIRAQAW